MKALKIIGIILLIVILLLLIIGALLPSEISIKSEIVIKAPSNVVFKQVNTMENWNNWSPFEEGQPDMITTYEGTGTGATQQWKYKNDSGKLTIVESFPYEKIVTNIDLINETMVTGNWAFESIGDSTRVTWLISFKGLSYPIGKYLGLLMPGKMKSTLSKGLSNLKTVAEKIPVNLYQEVEKTFYEAQPSLVIKDTIMMANMSEKMGSIYGMLLEYVNSNDIKIAGPPFTLYYSWWDEGSYLAAGFPTTKKEKGNNNIESLILGPGNVLKSTHNGPYDQLPDTYKAIQEYAMEFGYKINGTPWEVYVTDPNSTPDPADYVTVVYFPIE